LLIDGVDDSVKKVFDGHSGAFNPREISVRLKMRFHKWLKKKALLQQPDSLHWVDGPPPAGMAAAFPGA
jgi:hypothetical protein